jgi:hypothetical protein
MQIEITGKVAQSPKGNLVVTGFYNNKRVNVFVGNNYQVGDTIDGIFSCEENRNKVSEKGTLQFNMVMEVSEKTIRLRTAQANLNLAELKQRTMEAMEPADRAKLAAAL